MSSQTHRGKDVLRMSADGPQEFFRVLELTLKLLGVDYNQAPKYMI
jgi:hypothetical protein